VTISARLLELVMSAAQTMPAATMCLIFIYVGCC
jgi:hypothetical protein